MSGQTYNSGLDLLGYGGNSNGEKKDYRLSADNPNVDRSQEVWPDIAYRINNWGYPGLQLEETEPEYYRIETKVSFDSSAGIWTGGLWENLTFNSQPTNIDQEEILL